MLVRFQQGVLNMNVYHWKREGEFPRCRHCNGLMDFWDLRDEDQYEHTECAVKKFGEHIGKLLRKQFEKQNDAKN
jgi:hypothetical protein